MGMLDLFKGKVDDDESLEEEKEEEKELEYMDEVVQIMKGLTDRQLIMLSVLISEDRDHSYWTFETMVEKIKEQQEGLNQLFG